MIGADKRKAVYLLHQEGMGVREIARHLNISANTVSTIINQKGRKSQSTPNCWPGFTMSAAAGCSGSMKN